DLDGDGKADIISTSAHNYGFWWSKQQNANLFVQRSLFLNPFEVAKASAGFKLGDEERALYDAVNKVRTDHFKRAPFAVHPELCRVAQDLAEAGKKKLDYAYKGKVIYTDTKRLAGLPDAKDGKKDALSSLQKFALSMLPHNEEMADL